MATKKKKPLVKNGKIVKDKHGLIVYEGDAFVDIHGVFHPGTDDYNPVDYGDWFIHVPDLPPAPYTPTQAELDYILDDPDDGVGPYESQFDDQTYYEEYGEYRVMNRPLTPLEKGIGLALITMMTMGGAPVMEGASVAISEMALDIGAPPAGAFAQQMVMEGMIAGTGTLTGLSPIEMTINDAPTRKRNRDLSASMEYPDLVGWFGSLIKHPKKPSWTIPDLYIGPKQ